MLIRKRLPLNIILLASVPLIILGIVIYAYLYHRLEQDSAEKIKSLTNIQTNHLIDVIESEKLHTKVMTKQSAIVDFIKLTNNEVSANYKESNEWHIAKSFLLQMVSDSVLVQNYFVAGRNGNIILDGDKSKSLEGKNIQDAVYFDTLIKGQGIISDVFEPADDFGKVIIIAEPVYDNSHYVIGIVGRILDLDSIAEKVLGEKLGKSGYFYLTDSRGLIIAHPDKVRIGSIVENNMIKNVLRNLGEVNNEEAVVDTYFYRGEEKFVGYRIIPELNWALVAAQNMSEVRQPAFVILSTIVIVTVLLVIAATLVGFRISWAITKPIEEIMNNMRKATDGDLAVQCEITSKDEFGNLSNDFNIMIGKLNLSYEELTALYEQLTATEEELRAQYEELQNSEETQRRDAEKLEYMAYYDGLTHLPNRISFMNKLDEQISGSLQFGNRGAVLLIDLDNFKNINDTLGHDYGDMLIEEIAKRLNRVKDSGDIIYRFGGDEFVILRTTDEGCLDVEKYSKNVLRIIKEKYELGGKSIYISGSIGVAIYPDDGDSSSVILKNADTAMYKAKEMGKNRYELFNNSMYSALERKLQIEELLRRALTEDGFNILYQPQFDIATKEIIGFEALLRLNAERYGFISPVEFIPIAEESGLIIPIGEFILKEACTKDHEWRKKGYRYSTMSVNISSVQLQHPEFINSVNTIIKETGISPENLELEITESILMESLDYSVSMLKQLRIMGIKLALDDFGTGYSSLNYLKKLPITTLKMDKSFIDEVSLSDKEESIAKAIIEMAHIMKLTVVAEGVEQQDQLSILSKHSCDRVQGYLFSKPIPDDKVEELFKKLY